MLVASLLLTAALTVASELSYDHDEQRLLTLQTKLTGLVLTSALGQVQANLDRVAGLTAEAYNPEATFERAISPLMKPKGPYTSSSLSMVKGGGAKVLAHQGAPSFRSLASPGVTQLVAEAAHSSSLDTTRVVKGGQQRLGYLVSAPGHGAMYVVAVSQQLPVGQVVSVPRTSPDANLHFALYFGPKMSHGALIYTNSRHLPLAGTLAAVTVRFGDHVLTLVASPRGSLAGAWSEYTPWVILAGGVLISLAAASLSERVVRRRALAESAAALNRSFYQRQREVSEDLQRALLPKTLPSVAGFDMAATYLPGTRDIHVGGDWYSVVPVDEDSFVFVVGDVSGHDSIAAGFMGSLRYIVRAFAQLGMGPAEILERAGAELDVAEDHHFATVLVGKVDTARQELTLASAGHPPPLLIEEEQAQFLDVTVAVPLGVRGRPPEPTTVALKRGSTVVAFTDGLVERRGENLSIGLGRLAALALGRPATAAGLIDHILAALRAPDHEDDIALLVIQVGQDERAAGDFRPTGAVPVVRQAQNAL
ncbi:MAG TPA: PP2C family protein-serine/threonine phosphatase [Acidimicrobiales bacterium]|nr:PP2C family protein-serine/threonine phosphatase [Acidimicrobiales bacterium]